MFKIGDKIVLVGAVVFVGWLYSLIWFSDGHGDFAQISIDDKEQQLISLSENRILKMEGEVGISELEINDGKIRFLRSPCTNKICVHAGWLQRGGEFAACLPNRVAVEIVANNTLFDSINF